MFRSRRALKLFYSYAHEDENLREKLETGLALLKRQKVYRVVARPKDHRGQRMGRSIDENLASADIVLLLISPDFIGIGLLLRS